MGILELLIVILLVAWLLGVGTLGVMAGGGLIHVLLLIVLIVVVVRLLRGQAI